MTISSAGRPLRTTGRAAAGPRRRPVRRASPAATTLATRSAPTSYRRGVASAVGFCTRSKAPACSASMADLALGFRDAHDHHARRPVPGSARSRPSPSRSGIMRSSVTTSGESSPIFSSASRPSEAVPTTSRRGPPAQHLPQHLAGEGRVVHHQHAEGSSRSSALPAVEEDAPRSSHSSDVPNRSSDSETPTSRPTRRAGCAARSSTTRRARLLAEVDEDVPAEDHVAGAHARHGLPIQQVELPPGHAFGEPRRDDQVAGREPGQPGRRLRPHPLAGATIAAGIDRAGRWPGRDR